MDLAKRLLDYGFHAPTVYFPLTVKESIMIEPTETESRETLDAFAETLFRIIEEDPDLLHEAPTPRRSAAPTKSKPPATGAHLAANRPAVSAGVQLFPSSP